ncbi:MAG: magnesium transporter, partial [Legionella sp.]
MIIAGKFAPQFVQETIDASNVNSLNDALWIDMINPTHDEEDFVEECLSIDVPTREEMLEIELSSRLYKENGALFMTATMVAQAESHSPQQDAVTFILMKNKLITIRYIEPQAFKLFMSRLNKLPPIDNPNTLLTELLDATIDRFADILEIINHQLESHSKETFHHDDTKNKNYQQQLQHLGVTGELNSKIMESLVSFNRLIPFFDQSIKIETEDHLRLNTLSKDIYALSDHSAFLSNKISFLLEATLGMVQIEQNAIIKIFSVAAVIFLPPTLIA